MNRVEAALKKQMGAQGKVIVSDFSVDQINPQQRVGFPQYQTPPQPQHKVYDAQVTVSAETPKLELLGPSVEDAMKAGAVRLNQVSFSLKDNSAARKEAIEKASADAKSKAETLANSMGVKLKGVLKITTQRADESVYRLWESVHERGGDASRVGIDCGADAGDTSRRRFRCRRECDVSDRIEAEIESRYADF